MAEPEMSDFLVDRLRNGACFYDLGASVGYFTLIAARVVGEDGQVIAFEPQPRTAVVLRRNVELNGFVNVRVLERAVSDRDGSAHFDPVAELSQTAHLSDVAVAGGVEVAIVTIDGLVAAGARPPDLMKIDVEGAEADAVRGALETVERHRPVIVCEIHESRHEQAHEVERLLVDRGYTCGWLEPQMSRDRIWWAPHLVAVPPAALDG